MGELVDAFVARLPEGLRAAVVSPALEGELAALVARARSEAPGVELDPVGFAGYVAERVAFDREGRAVLEPLRAGALWIAFGCVSGAARAIAAFETQYAPEIGAALRRSFDRGLCEDAELALRERLFLVGEDDVPRLASYSGRGDLRAWLRAAAVRAAIDLMRGRRLVPVEAAALDASVADDDPLLAALKQRYRDEFRVAFAAAAATLTDRERTLLRYRFFDDLSIDEIGVLYRVHRATVARWISVIRERLFEETRARLMAYFELDDSAEADSILRLIDSHLDLSVEAMIRS
ncbi:MAG TPA: sigma-70 family RNA polymerase sigma factor [Kofleriaceae bacterium]|nr:sigma-70 family RNA polymerase sigma factor [Kofleriaceae bacterium]